MEDRTIQNGIHEILTCKPQQGQTTDQTQPETSTICRAGLRQALWSSIRVYAKLSAS